MGDMVDRILAEGFEISAMKYFHLPKNIVDLDNDLEDNIRSLAKEKSKKIEELTACVLDRPRHKEIIKKLKSLNVNLKLITDGDVCGALLVINKVNNIDIFIGIGGGPEGVLAAAALTCFGCQMQTRLLFQNENEIEILLSKTDPNFVHLCADTGHLLFAGVDPVEFFQKHINRIKHIHFKDIRADIFNNTNINKESFLRLVLKGIFTVPGDGCIDFITIGNNLKNSGYKGWIIVEAEQHPEKANPLEYALLSKKYLDKIWSD